MIFSSIQLTKNLYGIFVLTISIALLVPISNILAQTSERTNFNWTPVAPNQHNYWDNTSYPTPKYSINPYQKPAEPLHIPPCHLAWTNGPCINPYQKPAEPLHIPPCHLAWTNGPCINPYQKPQPIRTLIPRPAGQCIPFNICARIGLLPGSTCCPHPYAPGPKIYNYPSPARINYMPTYNYVNSQQQYPMPQYSNGTNPQPRW